MTSPPLGHRPLTTHAFRSARDRLALAAGLAFLDGVAEGTLGPPELRAWSQKYLVSTGWMTRPRQVQEPGFGSLLLPLEEIRAAGAPPHAKPLLAAVRARVVATLRAFIGVPGDDRFLVAAIYAGRVQRDSRQTLSCWVPSPRPDDALGDIVLSLFAADILEHREAYEASLNVCPRCDRVLLDPRARGRTPCACRAGGSPGDLLE